ncbi:MAG: hypothetical protein RMJ44_06025 [Cytophagales bacterium]|nr:hypothetical protein [Bernardetiaceae bacterium]MDW8210626.1 hypothetical protein [Cytophagales bacterium]
MSEEKLYWGWAEAGEDFARFGEMLRTCLYPALNVQALAWLLQTMQQKLNQQPSLLTTPLFQDAARLLALPKEKAPEDEKSSPSSSFVEPFIPHQAAEVLFVNAAPCRTSSSHVKILCTTVEDYIRIASFVGSEKYPHLALAEPATSPLFLYQVMQPSLFPFTTGNQEAACKIAALRYDFIAAQLPAHRPLPKAAYAGRDFLVVWWQSIIRLLKPQGKIVLIAPRNLLFDENMHQLRAHIAASFSTLQIFLVEDGQKILLHPQNKGKLHRFYLSPFEKNHGEEMVITSKGIWLALSEQPFWEGMPLDQVLLCPYQVHREPNRLVLHFDAPLPEPEQAIATPLLEWFTAHYQFEQQREEELARLSEAVQEWMQTEELTHCRAHYELSEQLRRWIQWTESKEAKQLLKKMENPDFELAKKFASAVKIFTSCRKTFDRLGSKSALDKESFAILRKWFEEKSAILATIQSFFDKPDFDAPAYRICKLDLFYYLVGFLQSQQYFAAHQYLLQYFEPRVYPVADFQHWVAVGMTWWKKFQQAQ